MTPDTVLSGIGFIVVGHVQFGKEYGVPGGMGVEGPAPVEVRFHIGIVIGVATLTVVDQGPSLAGLGAGQEYGQ
jgi:hypothetical protein